MAQHRWETTWQGSEPEPDLPATPENAEDAPDDSPGTRRRWAFTLPAAVLAVCLLLGCGAAVYLLRDRNPVPVASVDLEEPDASTQPPVGAGSSATGTAPAPDAPAEAARVSGPTTASGGAGVVVVHVAGAVQRPGVVRLEAGSRIVDAVDAAGGSAADADLAAVNLAAVLEDGAMVLVPRLGEAAPPAAGTAAERGGGSGGVPGISGGTGAGAGAAPGAGSPVNLNTADSAQLQELPRVGPVLAERIIAWRTEHGRFSRPEDLDAVPGIGEAMMAALLPLVTV
ncbi:helix-hairpin-helix domain-containing protein [Arthrobacter sp. zg-Y1143]|uniref:helix-hairpin-helix domain-containing protein n=1 Tax=Arthrobacter sp. zg-Y1143 TaxID=3049065 RepID=UPI0024C2A169|nr:helix-hairpin-helix domain-containing protein [Arthrobacter sp. zg-Y1143]MDK1327859.1 helix-hairpin-helix domain-containing protein [Arthrobacter sp. zg-Y1143]